MNKKVFLEFSPTPSHTDIQFLSKAIDCENPDYEPISQFGFFIRNDADEIIAGCNGYVICGCIYTDQLWVNKIYRKTGLGKQLMTKVEEYGKELNCTIATVTTMSFQNAKIFYEKLGYSVDFERNGYHKGVLMIFFSKKL